MSTGSPFQAYTADEIAHAKEACYLDHRSVCTVGSVSRRRGVLKKDGCESWSCAWSHDHSYLAWSAGHRIVQLIPWDNKLQRKHDPNDAKGLAGRAYHMINCGEIVHALAFGRTTTDRNENGKNGGKADQRWKRQRGDDSLGLVLATGHVSGRIKLWNCRTGKLLLEMLDHKDIIHDLHFAPPPPRSSGDEKNDLNNLQLASASRDGTVKLWEFDEQGDCNMYLTLKTPAKQACACRWSPDGQFVAVTGNYKMAMLFRLEGGKVCEKHRLEGHHHDVVNCDFSPDGALLATASFDTRVIVWDVYTHTPVAQLGHLHPSPRPIYAGGANDHYVYCVKFSPEGSRLVSVAEDGFVRVWQMPDLSDPVTIAAVEGARCCSFSSDGQMVATGTLEGSLTVLATPLDSPAPLLHLCRLAVRRLVTYTELSSLPVPLPLHEYLAYKNIQCE